MFSWNFLFTKSVLFLTKLWDAQTHDWDFEPKVMMFNLYFFLGIVLDLYQQKWGLFGKQICDQQTNKNSILLLSCSCFLINPIYLSTPTGF
jgi:hypothetical protein